MNSCCPPPPDKLIRYRRGLDTGEALVLRSVLESAGITVYLNDENMASMHYAVAADLVIREADKGRADALLAQVAAFPSSQQRGHGEEESCDTCGSTHVFKYVGDVPVFMGLGKSKAFPGSPWRKCLQCESFYRVDRRRITGHFPLALMWGGFLGGTVYGALWLIDFIKWL